MLKSSTFLDNVMQGQTGKKSKNAYLFQNMTPLPKAMKTTVTHLLQQN